ncbi:hypothetical protein C0993_012325 [Termitomyces sp. T159_Od127]|nr:hypothetical protein C0993_012325 [Termitomyces sp. T159_Od127]
MGVLYQSLIALRKECGDVLRISASTMLPNSLPSDTQLSLISTDEFRRKFKGHSANILNLVRYSRSSDDYSPRYKNFWMADVIYVYHKRGEFLSNTLPIDEQVRAWLEFGEQRKQFFLVLDQIAKDGKKWGARMRRAQTQDRWIMRNNRVAHWLRFRIKKRFQKLGFDDKDIDLFRKHPGIYVKRPLSDHDWLRVKEFYYPRILQAKTNRLRRGREALVEKRRRSLEAAYHKWIQDSVDGGQMVASQSVLLPRASELLDVEPFVSQIEAPSEVSVNFASLGNIFQAFISAWTARMLRNMVRLIPESVVSRANTSTPGSSNYQHLATATAVFLCSESSSPPLIGWKEVIMYNRGCDKLALQFFDDGSAIVRELLPLFGVEDPGRCLPSHLDSMNLRFRCLDCGLLQRSAPNRSNGRRMPGWKIFTWRECVRQACFLSGFALVTHGSH